MPKQFPEAESGKTILIVEDAESLQKLISMALCKKGYRVLQATTADEARLLSQEHAAEVDLLLTDQVMPGFSGVDLAIKMKRTRPDLKVICMSGFSKEDVLSAGDGALVAAFLLKPFSMADLCAEIERVLGSAPPCGRQEMGPVGD
ncbi:MAG: response regulator [Planctomycetes bacterium]|nr:response regulator [Planctomycetota bacterium]